MENDIRNDTKRKYLNNPSRLYDDSYMVNLLSKIVAEYSSCLFDFTYQHSEKSQFYQLNLAIFFIIYPDLRLEKKRNKTKTQNKKIWTMLYLVKPYSYNGKSYYSLFRTICPLLQKLVNRFLKENHISCYSNKLIRKLF